MAGNKYYNNPHIGAAAENIAKMFAPASMQDQLYAAKAAEVKQKMEGVAAMFGLDPSASNYRDNMDKAGVALGNYAPTQSYYSVDQGNLTSRNNNAADNTRMLTTNEADNARALEDRRLQEAGAKERKMLEGYRVGQNDTMFFPPQVAKELGMEPQLRGNVSAAAGETVVLPNAQGQIPRVADPKAVGPFTSEYPAPTVVDPNSVIKGVDKQAYQTITHPDGTTEVIPVSGAGKQTEFDRKLNLIAQEMAPGIAALNEIYSGTKSISSGALTVQSLFGDSLLATDLAQRAGIIDPDDQKINAAINSVMNQLYTKTGAARTEGEDKRGYRELTPLSSDTPEQRQQKRDMLNQKARGIIAQSKDPNVRVELSKAMDGLFTSPRVNQPAGGAGGPPPQAVELLRSNPKLAEAFDKKYGVGAAASILSGAPDQTPMPPGGMPTMPLPGR